MQNIIRYGSAQPGFHASQFCFWQPTGPKTRPARLGTNCLNMPWLWTLFFRCGMLQSSHLKNEPSSALIPYVRPDPLPLAEYCPLWLSPTRLPRLTVLFLAAHRSQNASYKARYQLPSYALALDTLLSMWDVAFHARLFLVFRKIVIEVLKCKLST